MQSERVTALVVTIALAAITVVADVFLKKASMARGPIERWEFWVGLVLYASIAFGAVYVMQHMKLMVVGVVYCVASVLLLAIVAMTMFGETADAKEVLGFVLALASLALLARFV